MKMIDKCSHGKTFDEDCVQCEIFGLRRSIKWMSGHLKRKQKRLDELLKTNPDLLTDDNGEG